MVQSGFVHNVHNAAVSGWNCKCTALAYIRWPEVALVQMVHGGAALSERLRVSRSAQEHQGTIHWLGQYTCWSVTLLKIHLLECYTF